MKEKSDRRNRKVLAPLATLLVAGAIAVGSGASFTSTSVNPGNLYATGTLTQSNSNADEAIFNMTNLKPGDVLEGQVTITNTGSLPAAFTLTEVGAVNGFETPGNLTLVVTDASDSSEVFSGTFGTMSPEALGVFAAGEARTYEFDVTLNAAAGNEEQAKQATATYRWDAIQTA
jgi:hypothetical protein